MASVLHRSRTDDTELARRVSDGDSTAFALLDARHRNALTRYAGSLLRRSEHDAEDVVQDVLIRAHEALRAGDLPVNQRAALLARELDGRSPEQVAAQLGVSVTAAHKLATRARANLIRSRDARDAGCPDVRAALLDAHERGARPTEHAVLHVKACRECRSYQRDVRRLRRQLHALNPALGLPVVAAVAHVVGGGAKAATAVAAAVAVVATGGVVVLRSDVHNTGDPAPFRLAGLRDENGRPLTAGKPIPGRTAIVTSSSTSPP